MRRSAPAVAVRAFVVVATLSVAQGASAAPSEGERLFREGRAAMQEKSYDVACAAFAESQRVEPAPGTALNLGDCEEHRGHLLAAKDAFALAASTYTVPDKKQYATSRAESIEQRIPRLVVRASTPVPGLVVRSGQTTIALGVELRMDPGDVSLTASAPGRRDKILPVTLRESRTVEIDVGPLEDARAAVQKPSPDRAPPPKPLAEGNGRRTLGFVVGGIGIAALGAGTVTGLMALSRASTVKSHCTSDLACDSEGLDAAHSGSTLSLVSTIAFIVGGAGVAAGAFFVFTSPSGRTALVPSASPEAASLALRRTF